MAQRIVQFSVFLEVRGTLSPSYTNDITRSPSNIVIAQKRGVYEIRTEFAFVHSVGRYGGASGDLEGHKIVRFKGQGLSRGRKHHKC